MSTLQRFNFNRQKIRTASEDQQVWFVASDVAKVLGYRMASDMTRRLDADDRGTRLVRTPSGDQTMTVISHTGLIEAALYRKSESAKQFRKWVSRTVLPEVMHNGIAPTPALAFDWTNPAFQRQMLESQLATLDRAESAEAQLAIVAPKVAGYDAFLDLNETFSLQKAAQLLCNEGFATGQNKLFEWMRRNGWLNLDNSPRQDKINAGFMELKLYTRPVGHRRNGEPIYAEPQARVTPEGLDRLRKVLTAPQPRQITAAPAPKPKQHKYLPAA